MSEEQQKDEQEAVQQLYEFVSGEMQAGSDKATIARKLEEQGVERREAEQMTGTIYDEIMTLVQKEQFTNAAVIPGLIGGLLAAALGGVVWATIVVMADYELGIIAWAIGGACGFGVVMAAGGRKGVPMQVIAVVTSVLGIAAGKYFALHYLMTESLTQEYGAEAVAHLTWYSADFMQIFVEVLPDAVSGYDALWVLFAMYTAWRIPQASGITVNSPYPQGPISPG